MKRQSPLSGVVDAGLQHERTALAWERTGLAVLVVGALLLGADTGPLSVAFVGVGITGLLLGVTLLLLGARGYQDRQHVLVRGGYALQMRLVRFTGLAVVVFGMLGLVGVLVGPTAA